VEESLSFFFLSLFFCFKIIHILSTCLFLRYVNVISKSREEWRTEHSHPPRKRCLRRLDIKRIGTLKEKEEEYDLFLKKGRE